MRDVVSVQPDQQITTTTTTITNKYLNVSYWLIIGQVEYLELNLVMEVHVHVVKVIVRLSGRSTSVSDASSAADFTAVLRTE